MLFGSERGSVFNATFTLREGAVVIVIDGQLDFRSAVVVREHFQRVWDLPRVPALIVDVAAVSFCDSVGLSELVTALQHSEVSGVRMMLSGVHGTLERVLTITGLRKAFEIHPSCAEALRAATGATGAGGATGAERPDGQRPCPAP